MRINLQYLAVFILVIFSCKAPESTLIKDDPVMSDKNLAVEKDLIIVKRDTFENLPGLFDIKYFDEATGELLFTHKNYNSSNLFINFVEIYNASPEVIQHLPPNTHYIISSKP